uniref:electron transport complex subunit RsxC n=1 Tax=uncultured Shewanella sp. TaxID=173975 RepID=UPI0026224865
MLSLLEQIDNGTLWQSPGGIHPPQLKSLSNQTKITRLPLAKEYIIPVPQLGEQAVLAVNVGEHVLKGTPLTKGHSATYLAVHAPTSGTLVAVEERESNHASGLPVLSCIIQADGLDTWCARTPQNNFQALTNEAILTRIQSAGIAGLGGAAFPTHIKLNPVSDIELLIINGIECEPYITSDDRLMREYSDDILTGINIIQKLIEPKRIIIAIEDNKPEAIKAIEQAIKTHPIHHHSIRVTAVPTKYPSGGEKQLIQILTGQEVPSGAIPAQLGMLVQNVGTAFAIKEAIIDDKPLIKRVVTLTGEQVSQPGNYWLPIGTPISHILSLGQTLKQPHTPTQTVIIGGPMMGYMLPHTDAPIIKGTNCLLLPSENEMQAQPEEKPCIRCGECAQVCPALLLPQQLFWHAQAKEYDKAATYNLQDCIECGCCSYVCPSDIPLVEYYRVAKSALREQAKDKQEADLAKVRFDARTQRLEDEKAAREAKQQQAASRRKANMSNKDSDVIAAAMARIKAKKESESLTSGTNIDNTPVSPSDVTPQTDKKAQIAAALARAKAKKAQASQATPSQMNAKDNTPLQTPDEQSVMAPTSDKKAQIAAAIARAKAKKAQAIDDAKPSVKAATTERDNASAAVVTETTISNVVSDTASDPAADKKAKIAAAIARAKAKKAKAIDDAKPSVKAATTERDSASAAVVSETTISNAVSDTASDPTSDKKARIAAAVAKAKAKKAQATVIKQPIEHTITEREETPAQFISNVASDPASDKK